MKKIWPLLHHRIVWAIGGALLAGVAAPVMVGLVLKALGLLHGASLHTWLLDVGQNVTPIGAAGGAAAGAAAGGGPIPQKDKDPDPCAAEARAVLADQGTIDNLKSMLATTEAQIEALNTPIDKLAAQASALASQANRELAKQFAVTVLTKVVQGLMVAMGDPAFAPGLLGGGEAATAVAEVGTTIDTATNPLSQVKEGAPSDFADSVSFFNQMNQYFQASQGDVNALQALASANNMPAVTQFVNVMNAINQLIDKGCALVNSINNPNNGIQQKLDEAQNQLKQDQKDLQDCKNSNAGGGGSGSGGSGGGDSGGGDAGADA
jgi:uncharacterized membrane protein YgcG